MIENLVMSKTRFNQVEKKFPKMAKKNAIFGKPVFRDEEKDIVTNLEFVAILKGEDRVLDFPENEPADEVLKSGPSGSNHVQKVFLKHRDFIFNWIENPAEELVLELSKDDILEISKAKGKEYIFTYNDNEYTILLDDYKMMLAFLSLKTKKDILKKVTFIQRPVVIQNPKKPIHNVFALRLEKENGSIGVINLREGIEE